MKKYITIITAAFIFAACSNDSSIVGTWSEIHKDENGNTITSTETYNEDGTFSSEMTYTENSKGGNILYKGTYNIKQDSLILYMEKVTLMGVEVPLKNGNRSASKIIKLTNDTFIHGDADGSNTELKRIDTPKTKTQ